MYRKDQAAEIYPSSFMLYISEIRRILNFLPSSPINFFDFKYSAFQPTELSRLESIYMRHRQFQSNLGLTSKPSLYR